MGSSQSQLGPGMVVAEEGGFWPTGAGEAFQRFVVLGAQLRRECTKVVGCGRGCGAEVWRRSWERAQARDVGIMVGVCGGWAYVISGLAWYGEKIERKKECVVGEDAKSVSADSAL